MRGQRDTGIRYGTDLRGADVDLSQEDSTLQGNEGGFKTGEGAELTGPADGFVWSEREEGVYTLLRLGYPWSMFHSIQSMGLMVPPSTTTWAVLSVKYALRVYELILGGILIRN